MLIIVIVVIVTVVIVTVVIVTVVIVTVVIVTIAIVTVVIVTVVIQTVAGLSLGYKFRKKSDFGPMHSNCTILVGFFPAGSTLRLWPSSQAWN